MNFIDIRRRIIVALFSDDTLFDQLVLKGGNAISLIYGLGNRASLDLDFSIENDFNDVENSKRRIFTVLEEKFGEIGFTVFDKKFVPRPQREKPNMGQQWGGYQLEFKLIETSKEKNLVGDLEAIRRNALVVGPDQMRCFTVDLSKYEYCTGKVEKELDNYTIYVYTPEMIVVEKLRAICQQMPAYELNTSQRARARDFYDIHLLVAAEGIDLTTDRNVNLIKDIFLAKQVPIHLLRNIEEQYERHRLDWPAVKDSVSVSLNDFDFYFNFVLGEVAKILKILRVV